VGITTDNVSPMNLIYIRKVGYGVRRAGAIQEPEKEKIEHSQGSPADKPEDLLILQRILQNALEGLR